MALSRNQRRAIAKSKALNTAKREVDAFNSANYCKIMRERHNKARGHTPKGLVHSFYKSI